MRPLVHLDYPLSELHSLLRHKFLCMGSGCGSVGRVVSSPPDLWFKQTILILPQIKVIYYTVLAFKLSPIQCDQMAILYNVWPLRTMKICQII